MYKWTSFQFSSFQKMKTWLDKEGTLQWVRVPIICVPQALSYDFFLGAEQANIPIVIDDTRAGMGIGSIRPSGNVLMEGIWQEESFLLSTVDLGYRKIVCNLDAEMVQMFIRTGDED